MTHPSIQGLSVPALARRVPDHNHRSCPACRHPERLPRIDWPLPQSLSLAAVEAYEDRVRRRLPLTEYELLALIATAKERANA